MDFLSPLHRYTRFVHLSKGALWALAILLTLAIVVTAWVKSNDNGGRITLGGGTGKPQPSAMIKPRYQGLDSHDRPFNIIAETATQPDQNTVILEMLSTDIVLDSGGWASMSADHGVYHVGTKLLELTGHVDMFYDGGYEFRTDAMQVDIGKSTAWGDNPVEGQGPAGILRAHRFKILDRGKVLLFNEAVKVNLYLK